MKMNHKALLILFCALVMTLTGVFAPVASAATVVDSLTVSNLLGSLGEATQYGVVAREWDQGGHAETNACVDVLDRHVNTVFSNTDSTYFHALGYTLAADVTAPANQSLNGMTFALFKEAEDGSGFVMIEESKITFNADVSTATMTWDIDGMSRNALKDLKNTRLYVMQVNSDGTYVEEAERNEANLVVNYGPSISASAYNTNYIGKIHYPDGVPDSVGIFNTTGNTPSIILGADTRLYYQNSAGEYVMFDPADTTVSTQYVMVNVYYGDPEQMTYAKLDGISVQNGVFTRNGDIIKISYSDDKSRAAELLEDAEAYSKQMANIGGGVITSLTPNPEGGSTVHGPVTEDGHVLSLYDVEVGSDGEFKVKDDMGWDGIPVAPNEYVVINLICPSKDGEVLVGPGASDITYFFEEGQTTGEGVQWGTEDSNSSQRVIFNFVYADENGVMQPFEGTIVPHSRHGGTLLAPKAKVSVTGEVHNGSIIADNVYNGQEIHQRSLSAGTRSTWVRMNGGYLTLEKASLGYDWSIPPYGEWVDMSDTADLSDAVFGVYTDESCSEESLVSTLTTDETGAATSELLSAGTYWIKEITPLKDHNLMTNVVEVTVTAGQTAQVQGGGYQVEHEGHWDYSNIYNPVWVPGYTETIVETSKFVNWQNNGYTSLRVLKNDEFGNVLQGAEFGVYTRERINNYGPARYRYTLVASGFTNRNGVAIIENVPLSYQDVTYYVREITPPEGYASTARADEYVEITLSPDDRDQIITIDGNGDAEGIAFVNNIIRGNLALKKVDSKTNANLAGAEFTIYSDKDCTQAVGVMTTKVGGDADSRNVIAGKNGLVPGTYYVKETKAPDGYMVNDKVFTVQVVADKMVDVATGEIVPGLAEATGIPNDQAIHLYGTKLWYDEGYENNRPNEVKIELYKNGQFLREAKVSAQTEWKFEFLNLPRYDEDGNEIEYTVRENLQGKQYDYYAYTDGIDGSGNVNIVVANSIRRVEVTGEKAWEDTVQDDPDRPESITFLLYQEVDGELVPVLDDWDQQLSVTGGAWEKYRFKFENLPLYDANGDVATYVVKEAESDKYLLIDTTVTEREDQNKVYLHYTLTNRMTVPLSGSKVWQDSSDYQGRRPENVTLVVYRNGTRMPPHEQPTIVWDKTTDTDVWTWKVEGLPKYDANNNLNIYTVKEEPVPAGYTGTVSEDGLTFYNTIPGSIRLYKVYVDGNGAYQVLNGAEFKLYYDAACQNPVSDEVYVTSHVSNTRNGFIEITDVVPGDYYIREEKAPTGFVLPVPNDPIKVTVVAGQMSRVNGDHGVVVNVPNSEAVTIKVDKTWVGDEGKEDARPQSITIQLYQNDTAMAGKTLELNAANNWSGEFTKLPNLDDGGNPYTYTVKEAAVVPGYVGSVTGSVEDGFTVTNTYNNTEITVTKKWEGPVSADDMGPVEVQLLANGVSVGSAMLNADNSWTHTFQNLPIGDETGAEIAYTVEETTPLADFSVTYTGDKDSGFVVTNTAKVGKITLTKVDAESGKALKGAKFGIYSDEGCQTLVEEITTGDDGKATSGDLLPGTYYVKESEAPSGYKIVKTDAVTVTVAADQTVQAMGDGADGAFTNEQGKGKLYVKKVGTDSSNNNAQPLAGAEFTVYQYPNGQKTEVGKIITDENGYGEIALPMGDYMVQETKAPEGYKINDSSEKWVTIRAVDEEVQVQGGFNYNNEYGWFQNTSTAVGSIKLTKVSAKDETVKLQGAVFGVYSDQNCQNKVGEMTTDANGEATYEGLEANRTYYVKETTAPEGYELNTQVYGVMVAANAETAVNGGDPIPNEAEREKGAISLVKVSAVNADTKLAGAVFGVYSDESCTTKVGEMTTDANGAATYEGLFADETYWVKEIKAPSGYVLNEDKFSVTVVANTTTAVNNGEAITNDESEGVASIYLYKVATDTSGNNATGWLAGAEFDVYNVVNWSKGTKIGSMTTDENGYAEFTVPAIGNYIVAETKAPAGYERDYNERWVTVNNEGDRVQVNGDKSYNGTNGCIGNKKQQTAFLELYKLGAEFDADGNADYATMELLSGVEFTVTANDNSIDPIVFTTENGYAKVELPANMNLTLKETKAPEGYELTENAQIGLWLNSNETRKLSWWGTSFQNTNGSQIYWPDDAYNGSLINKKIEQPEGGFMFTKRNVIGETLPGAVFGVYSEEACTTKLHELTSGEDGVVSLTGLEAGKTYYIKEITAPTGYGLNETVYSVTIEADVDDKQPDGTNGVIINERNSVDLCVYKNWHNANGEIENDTLGVDVSGALELYILSADGTQTLVKGTDGNALRPVFEDGVGENEADLYWWRNMPILSEGDQYIVKEDLSKVPAGVVVHYNSDPEGTNGYETSEGGYFTVYNSYFNGFEIFVANKKVDGQYVEDVFAFELVDAKTGEVVVKEDSVFGPDITGLFDPDNPPPEEEWVNQVMLRVDYDKDDLPTTVDGLTEYEYILREVNAGGDYIYDTAEYEYKVTIDRMGKTKVFIKLNDEYQPFTFAHDEPVFENKVAVSISGTKVWDDNNNAGGMRPEEITIWLYADGVKTDKSVTLKSGETDWSFTGLPKYAADGREIIYTADESKVPDGYVRTITGDAASGFVITNALKQGEGELRFLKMLSFGNLVTLPAEGYTFTFTLTPDENTPDAYTVADNAELAEDVTSITPVVENGKVVSYTLEKTLNADVAVTDLQVWSYLKFTFTEPGTYTFTLQEQAPDPIPEGWVYDTTPHTIQFVVTEGETELIVKEKDESNAPEIRNELKTTETTVFKYWKDIGYEEDRLDRTELPEYLYLRYSTDNGATWTEYGKLADLQTQKEIAVVVEDWGGGMWYINVKKLPAYIGGKTVQWSFVEKLPEGSPYETVYGDINNLDVTAGLTGTDADHICIVNIHEIEMTFEGTKTLTGREMTADDVFSFEVTEEGTDNKWTVYNDETGKIHFPTFNYGLSDIGLHKYTVKETSAAANGIKADDRVYELEVTVDVMFGSLILNGFGDCYGVDFTNAYEAKGEITFEGTKTIEGREWREDDIYYFEVCEEGIYYAVAYNDENGKINYPTIEYTQLDVGEHTYTIREISDSALGLTVDETEYTVTVKVTDNRDGTLTVEATGDDHTKLDFTNTYKTEGSIQFSGVKTMHGKELTGDDFSFQLIGEDGTVIETVTNDAYGNFAFTAIKYDQDDAGKAFTYTVKEVNDGQTGVSYDSNVYTVTVTVVDDGYGTLTAISNISESNMNFTNTYEAVGEITFKGTKTIKGRDMTATDVFTFSLMEGETEIATVSNDADGNIVFPTIEYHLYDVGEHIYTVKETSADGNGITVDMTEYTVVVTVEDDGDGKLEVTADVDPTTLEFVNTYKAEGSIQLSGVKTLTGKALAGDDFSFELLNEDGTVIETVTNDADGKFAFSAIEYNQYDEGSYIYTVQEVNDGKSGITYDDMVYTMTVIVEDNGDGTLYVTADLDYMALNFVNTYEAKGEITFSGTKTIEGRALTENDVFAFAVKEGEKTIVTASNDADGNIVFPTIEYTLADVGTHTYTVKETSPSGLGITADPTEYTVTVTVEDTGDGELLVTASANFEALDFTNTYEAEGEITFAGVKTIEGRALTANDKFTFEIKEGDKTIATVENDADGKIAYPTIEYTLADVGTHTYTVKETSTNGNGITVDTTEYTVVVTVIDAGHGTLDAMADVDHTALNFTNTYKAEGEIVLKGTKTLVGRELAAGEFEFELIDEAGEVAATATNDAEGKITFTKMTYDTADIGKTYTYTAKEITGNLPGVTYDTAPITVKVAIADVGDGTLNVTKTVDSADIAFTNTYSAEGAILLAGTKSLSGRTLKAGEFSFELYDANGNLLQTVTNDAKGAIAFAEIKYELTDAGKTFTYTVKEKSGTLPGVTYDDTVITVEVEVKDVGGTLTATLTQKSEAIAFTNTYEATGEITFEGTKTIDGRAMTANDLFTFEVKEGNDVLGLAMNDATGKIAYPTIAYTLADVGTHTYAVRETNTDGDGITVDTTVYTVTVTVSDNGDGTLKVEASDNATELDFTNTYAADGSVQFAGTKTLTGKALVADEFSFRLIDENGDVIETVKNDANGEFTFDAINYDLDDIGTHTYTVKEVNDGKSGVTYDDTEYTVTVEVMDAGNGELTVTASDNATALDFVNEYAADGSVQFSGSKTLTGKTMAADDFSFELIGEDGNVIETVKNDADGKFSFSEIAYDLSDAGKTFTYTVKEVNDGKSGVTYDTTEYTVTVEVADAGDGSLTVTASDNATALDFVNEYAADGKIAFSGSKTLTGKALVADEFSFRLIDENGDVIETVKNDANGEFTFDAINYDLDDIGTHTYTVKEVNDGKSGITYDDAVYTVEVTVEDAGDGTLTVTATDNATALDFTNTYAADGSVQFSGSKTLTGKTLAADEFSFRLIGEDGNVIETVKNDADGKFAFSEITYDLSDAGKTFTYTVKEVNDGKSGVTYDDTEYTVTVEVTDAGDGSLTVTASDNATALDFTNTYEAEGEITFAGVKIIEGRALTANDKFTFEIKEGEKTIATVTNDADGKIAYPTIEYTLDDVGTHTYTVKETSTNGNGITVDTTEYTVVVTVIDAGHGTLDAMADVDHTALNFTNTYKAEGEIVLKGTKTLVGRELAAGEFEFELIDEAGDVAATATNDAEGKITFTKMTYDTADIGKTYTYTAKEITGNLPGVTYDTAPITVKVAIADAGDGTLNVTKTVDSADIAFTNTYSAEGAILLAGTKSLSGRTLKAGEFSFELYDANGELLQTVTNDAKGAIAFAEIKYELADAGKTFTYTVKEKAGNLPGVTYDDTVITVEVKVEDVGGKLTATLTQNSKAIAFTNTYEANGEITFEGTKTIDGRAMTANDLFTFEVKEGNDVLGLAMNDATGKIAYPTIAYTLADVGTHTYAVRETNTDGDGITVDTTVYTVEVTVEDAGDGTLTVTATDNATALDFTNTYAADGKIAFSGSKTLTGKALVADEFSFRLIDENGDVIETVKNDANGEFTFDAINYDLDDIGTHTYTVKEVNDGKSGVTYDDAVYTVEVTVEDAGDGSLTVTASDNATVLDFVNEYAADGSVQFSGSKTLTGKTLAADDFSFELIGEDGTVIETVKNDADGKFSFSEITYDLADAGKTFTYTVKEVNDGKEGVTYDATTYTVEVTVEDAGDGSLTVTASDNATALDFVNEYAADGSVQFSGSKTLTGKALVADEFSFRLIDENGDVIETVKNDADGKFAFSTITYDLSDAGKTFTYTVKEVNDGKSGVTYDDAEYTVTVEVADAGDGSLTVTATDNATALDFTNTYAADGSVQFAGTKTLTGKALAADDFSFQLIGEDGNVIETVKNGADGKFAFSAIAYDLADAGKTFTYTVKEVNDGKSGVTYDTTEYTVTVEVEDAGNGELTVTASDNATALNFTNTYAADGSVQFTGTKTLTGKVLVADEFSFRLIDENGDVIETVKNDANGEFTFDAINYDLDDIGTHTYTVKEVNDGKSGVTYDDAVYTVEVTVADAGDGSLTVTATDNATALDFVNEYAADGSVQFSGSKTLTGKALAADDFSFELIGEDGNVIETVKNGADGKFAFSAIAYDLADAGKTFTYTVKEVNDGKSGVTYDDAVYTVEVTVADAGDGSLTVTATDNATALDFVNEYAADGSVQFSGSKTLTGKTLAADDFSFQLIGEDGTVIETVKNGADGKFAFSAIAYDLADAGKIFTYTVKEVNDGKSGVTYDTTEYTVTVEVADAGNGELTVTASDNATALDFTNTYAADGSVQFSGSKTLTGKTLAADDFSFQLIGEDGTVIETVKNDADGKFSFSTIVYDLSDAGKTFTYTVKEVNDGKSGVTYDDAEYTVTVEVADAGDGTLTVTATDNATALDFTNTYAADGSVQFSGSKTLTGKTLAADDFSFQLIGEDGNVIETVKNGADGKFAFSAITYDLADAGKTFTYTVKEVNDGKEGVTYDATTYTVTVTVSDNGDGTLKAEASANAAALTFVNTYAADGEIVLAGTKTLTGRALEADMFSFELLDEDGNVIETVKNGADGSIVFSAIAYELADAGKTFTYTVREAADSRPYYTTDSRTYTVEVAVALDAANGKLTTSKTVLCDGAAAAAISFTNTYTAQGSLQLTALKSVNGGVPADDQVYEFLLEGEGVSMTATNEGESIVFGEMTYDLEDVGKTFTYTISETTPSAGNMTADDTVYTIEVTVIDNGDGTLTASPVATLAGETVGTISFDNKLEAPLTITKTVEGCETTQTFAMTVYFFDADGAEMTEPVTFTGDVRGTLTSGETIRLGHGQSVTFSGLTPGMRYIVEEEGSVAFTAKVNGQPGGMADGVCSEDGNRIDFVNTMKTTSFSVTKRWEGAEAGDIILTLYADGEKLDPQPAYTRDGDTYTYTGLPMYNEDGEEIVYAAKEKYMDGYLTIYDNKAPYEDESRMIYNGGTIINRAVTDIRVRKVWNGLEDGETAPEITLTLYCNGEATSRKQPSPDEDGWYTYKNLPAYANGEAAVYYVLEEPVDGFKTTYTDENGQPMDCAYDSYTITNTKIPATGDHAPLTLWAAMFTASSALLLMMLKRRRKEN